MPPLTLPRPSLPGEQWHQESRVKRGSGSDGGSFLLHDGDSVGG